MTVSSHAHIDRFLNMDPTRLARLPAEELLRIQKEVDALLLDAKSIKHLFDTFLDHRFALRARNVRISHGKDTGAVHFEDGPVTISANLPKRVKWDQGKLADIIETIRNEWREDPAQYVKTELKVSEAAYGAWPEVIRELFRPARTVATGKPSYRLEITKHGEDA